MNGTPICVVKVLDRQKMWRWIADDYIHDPGREQHSYTGIVFHMHESIYHATIPAGNFDPFPFKNDRGPINVQWMAYLTHNRDNYAPGSLEIRYDDLPQVVRIEESQYKPLAPPRMSIFRSSMSNVHHHIKRPRLVYYRSGDPPNQIAENFLAEALICQKVKDNPHPNLARFLGAMVDEHGRLTGLCFTYYAESLLSRFGRSDDEDNSIRVPSDIMMRRILDQLGRALNHLESMGFIHASIAPSKVMLDVPPGHTRDPAVLFSLPEEVRVGRIEGEVIKLGGFDSVKYANTVLRECEIHRPTGWYDIPLPEDGPPEAHEELHERSMESIERWLYGSSHVEGSMFTDMDLT